MTEPVQVSFDFVVDRELSYEEFTGRVTRIIFENPETGWKVVEAEPEGGESEGATAVRLAGFLPGLGAGDAFHCRATRSTHERFGACLQVDEFERVLPYSREAVTRFMIAMLDGIGESLAAKIVERFGAQALPVLETEPERLLSIEGVSPKLLDRIRASTRGIDSTVKELMLCGFSAKWAGRIYLKYGREAAEKVKRRPYRLIQDFKGIGFRKADVIALATGTDRIDAARIGAALRFVMLSTLKKTGHTYLPLRDLLKQAVRLLDLPPAYVEGAILADPGLVIEEERVYLPEYHEAEKAVARRIADLAALPRRVVADFEKRMEAIERRIGIGFSAEQKAAIREAVESPVTVVTGAAGTGKSTLCRGLLALLDELGLRHEVCAPTGKAAKKLEELTGEHAATIHRLFRYVPHQGFRVNREHPLETDLLVVDETSMVDLLLMKALLEGISPVTRVVFIGDPHQLPPVDSGDALRALLGSYSVAQAVLPRIFRQAKESTILRHAGAVKNEQAFPKGDAEDFAFIDTENPVQMVWELYNAIEELSAAGFDPVRDVNVLTPLNKGGGEISVSSLNRRLRDRLNPERDGNAFRVYEREFRLGDKVMQRKNDYELEIFNGDIGYVTGHDEAAGLVEIDFSGAVRRIPYRLMDNVVLNYAMTVHKAQGSEARAVIFLATRAGAYFLLNRHLFYTAMTRAKEKLVMIMPYDVVKTAVRFGIPRRSHLADRIQALVIGREG